MAAIWKNATRTFWLDEIFTGAVACQDSFAKMMPLITHDVHPVGYHILVHLLFDVTGCNLWPVRLLSLICSLSGAYLLIRKIASLQGNVFLAAALTLGNPTFWSYAFEARAYGLLFLAGCGVVVYALSERPGDGIKAIGFALLGGLLHYYAEFLFVALFVIVMNSNAIVKHSRSFWIFYSVALLSLCAYYLPQIGNAIAAGQNLTWIPKPTMFEFFLGFPSSLLGSFLSAIVIAIIGLLISSVFLSRPTASREGKILITIFVCAVTFLFGISFFRPSFIYRYLHFLVPAMVMGSSLLARDAEFGLREQSKEQAETFSKIIYRLIQAYLFLNLCFLVLISPTDRSIAWQKAKASMQCIPALPCGFVLDTAPVTPGQYNALAHFGEKQPGSFIAVQPQDLPGWVNSHPGAPFLYVQALQPVLEIQQVIHTVPPLACNDFQTNGLGAMVCHAVPK